MPTYEFQTIEGQTVQIDAPDAGAARRSFDVIKQRMAATAITGQVRPNLTQSAQQALDYIGGQNGAGGATGPALVPPSGPVGATHAGVADPRMGAQGQYQQGATQQDYANAQAAAPGQLLSMVPFGLGDEAAGVFQGAGSLLRGGNFGEGFDQGQAGGKASMETAGRIDPGGTNMLSLIGNAAAPMGAARAGLTFLRGAKPTMASLAPRMAAEGASYGALSGAGHGDTAMERGRGALLGGVTGGALGATAGAVGGTAANASMLARAPTQAAMAAEASALYRQARTLGMVYEPASVDAGYNTIITNVTQPAFRTIPTGAKPYTPQMAPQAFRVVADMRTAAAPTLDDIESVRSRLSTIARESADPLERGAARSLRIEFDNWRNGLTQADMLTGGDPTAAHSLLSQGRQLWATQAKADVIADAFHDATLASPVRSGARGQQTALISEFRRIAKDDGLMRMFSAAEREAIEAVARGTWTENAFRAIGYLAPYNPITAYPAAGAAFFAAGGNEGAGITAGLGTMAAGTAAAHVSGAMTRQAARYADALVRSRGAGGAIPWIMPSTQYGTSVGAGVLPGTPGGQSLFDLIAPQPQGVLGARQ